MPSDSVRRCLGVRIVIRRGTGAVLPVRAPTASPSLIWVSRRRKTPARRREDVLGNSRARVRRVPVPPRRRFPVLGRLTCRLGFRSRGRSSAESDRWRRFGVSDFRGGAVGDDDGDGVHASRRELRGGGEGGRERRGRARTRAEAARFATRWCLRRRAAALARFEVLSLGFGRVSSGGRSVATPRSSTHVKTSPSRDVGTPGEAGATEAAAAKGTRSREVSEGDEPVVRVRGGLAGIARGGVTPYPRGGRRATAPRPDDDARAWTVARGARSRGEGGWLFRKRGFPNVKGSPKGEGLLPLVDGAMVAAGGARDAPRM